MPTKSKEEILAAAEFRTRLMKHQERKARGWVTRVSEATGIDLTTMSHIKSGRRGATTRQMLAIAGALKAPSILPPEIGDLMKVDRSELPGDPVVSPRMSAARSSVPRTPIPASLRAFFDAHPDLHPGVKWELEENHEQRLPEYIPKDEFVWNEMAKMYAAILGIAEGPYRQRGKKSPGPSGPGAR